MRKAANDQSRELRVQCNRWVVNQSSRVLSDLETNVLARGLLHHGKYPYLRWCRLLKQLESAQHIRLQLVGLLSKDKPPPCDMSREEMNIVKSLKRDNIVSADKGCAFDHQKYNEKLPRPLSDETTYRKLKRDPAPSLERRFIAAGAEGRTATSCFIPEIKNLSWSNSTLVWSSKYIHKPDSSPTYHDEDVCIYVETLD